MKRGEDPPIVVERNSLRVAVVNLQTALSTTQAQLAAKEQEIATIKATYSKQLESQQGYYNQSSHSLVAKTQEVQTLTAQLAQKTAECQTLTTNLANLKLASDAKDVVIANSKNEYKLLEDKAKSELKTLSDKSLSDYKLLEDKTALEYHNLEAKDRLEIESLKIQLKTSVTNNELMQKYVISLEKDKEELRYDKEMLRDEVVDLVSSVKNFHKKDTHEVAQEVILDKSFSMNEHSHVEFLQSDVEIKIDDSLEAEPIVADVGVVLNISGQSDSFQEI